MHKHRPTPYYLQHRPCQHRHRHAPARRPRPCAHQSRREALSSLAAGVAAIGCSGDGSAVRPDGATGATSQSPTVFIGAGGNEIIITEPKAAEDRVEIGNTGIVTSRMAFGSGSFGGSGSSDQMRLGIPEFANLLVQGYDRGITFWDTADMYGTHNHVRDAIAQVGRQNVQILSKSIARTAEEMEADLIRFQEELGTDYIDILLLHQCESATWTEERAGAMEVLDRAKQEGIIRAHGVSCHTMQALELASRTPWVDVDLARLNPFSLYMEGWPEDVLPVLERMKAQGTAIIGMKLLALGEAFNMNRFDEAIAFAVAQSCMDAFTIGFTNTTELDEVRDKIYSMGRT